MFTRGYEGGVAVNLGHVAIAVGGGEEIVAPTPAPSFGCGRSTPGAVQAVRRVIR